MWGLAPQTSRPRGQAACPAPTAAVHRARSPRALAFLRPHNPHGPGLLRAQTPAWSQVQGARRAPPPSPCIYRWEKVPDTPRPPAKGSGEGHVPRAQEPALGRLQHILRPTLPKTHKHHFLQKGKLRLRDTKFNLPEATQLVRGRPDGAQGCMGRRGRHPCGEAIGWGQQGG